MLIYSILKILKNKKILLIINEIVTEIIQIKNEELLKLITSKIPSRIFSLILHSSFLILYFKGSFPYLLTETLSPLFTDILTL